MSRCLKIKVLGLCIYIISIENNCTRSCQTEAEDLQLEMLELSESRAAMPERAKAIEFAREEFRTEKTTAVIL